MVFFLTIESYLLDRIVSHIVKDTRNNNALMGGVFVDVFVPPLESQTRTQSVESIRTENGFGPSVHSLLIPRRTENRTFFPLQRPGML